MTDAQPEDQMNDLAADGASSRTGGQFGDVRAQRVELSQGGASSITAQTVTVNQGGAGRVRATDMSISQGGVALARVDRLTLNDGAGAFAVLADEVSMSGQASAFLLVAGRTNGPVTAAVDVRAALAFGAAFALVLALLRRVL